jgi:magnesium transporter
MARRRGLSAHRVNDILVGHRIAGIFRCRRKNDGKEVLLCFFQCGTAVTRSMLMKSVSSCAAPSRHSVEGQLLRFHNSLDRTQIAVGLAAAALPPQVNWIDALDPTPEETAFIERVLALAAPSRGRMSEIETSSRLYSLGDTLYLTIPMIYWDAAGIAQSTPLAFVLGKGPLLTMRLRPIKACDARPQGEPNAARAISGGVAAFIALLDEIVDQLADELEGLTANLDDLARGVFLDPGPDKRRRAGGALDLRLALQKIGQARRSASKISETLLGVIRMQPFVTASAVGLLTPEVRLQFDRIGRDAASLNDHEARLSDRIQFLLDATLGLIGVDQNDIFKVLTMVSVVGIPPTLIASMYGMNFKNISEYDWAWGYQYGLAMIALSAIIPLIWFKWRAWW